MSAFDMETYKRKVESILDGIRPMNDGLEFVMKKLNQNSEDSFATLYYIMKNAGYDLQPGQIPNVANVMESFLMGIVEEAQKAEETVAGFKKYEEAVLKDDVENLPERYTEGYYDYGTNLGRAARFMDDILEEYSKEKQVLDYIHEVQKSFWEIGDAESYMQVILRSDPRMISDFQAVGRMLEPLERELTANFEKLEDIRNRVFETLYDRANAEVEKTFEWLGEHEDAFQMMNLKLHDASYYEWRGLEDDFPLVKKAIDEGVYGRESSPFYEFCEYSYDCFTEWCAEKNIDFHQMQRQVGRTSSFYLHDEGNLVCLSRRDYSIDENDTLGCLVEQFGYSSDSIYLDGNGRLDKEGSMQNMEDAINNIEYLASGALLPEVQKHFADMIEVYEYIKDTKDNQVQYFKDWLEYETERIESDYPEIKGDAEEDREDV